jgi:nitric oxide reductase NorD protein
MNFKFWTSKKKSSLKPKNTDEQPEYEIKAYSKDGGYIRSPVRTGKNQNSSSYGGMGEREVELRLELLVEPVLNPKRTVFKPAQLLSQSSLADQERFIASVDELTKTDIELAFQFCHLGAISLKVVEELAWQDWIKHINSVYMESGIDASIETMQALEKYIDSTTYADTSVSYQDISRIVESIITGLNGRSLMLKQSDRLFTDTETIHLPENISTFSSYDENFSLYKTIAIHQWAQSWFGTWRVDVQQLTQTFSNPADAVSLFHSLETVRLDANIERELPGIARAMKQFNSLLNAQDLPPTWQQAVTQLSQPEASAHDSASLLYALYDDDYRPQATLYQGELDPSLAREKMNERVYQDKSDLQARLNQLEQELISDQPDMPMDEDEEAEDKRFQVKEIDDDEVPDGYRVELEFDGEDVETPDDIQELLDSIQQDLGEIPEDYLQTDQTQTSGGDSDVEQEIALREDDSEVFLYDEWDHSRQQYRKQWCQLREYDVTGKSSDFVEQTLAKHRNLLKQLHRTFEALREEDRRIHKQPYGEDIDLDAVINSYADIINGEELDQNLFIKQRKVDRNIAVMFMVDMSGSTSGWINDMEREALVLLCESLEKLGDRYAIYGFSGVTHEQCDLYRIKEFDENYSSTVKERIANIKPKDYTRMGVAIRHLSKLLAKVEAKTKVLITLSDGRPDDRDGYRGVYGIEDTRRALIEAKYLGIHPFCITIDEEAMDYLQHMYGPVNFAIVNQIDKLPYKVSDIYRRLTM